MSTSATIPSVIDNSTETHAPLQATESIGAGHDQPSESNPATEWTIAIRGWPGRVRSCTKGDFLTTSDGVARSDGRTEWDDYTGGLPNHARDLILPGIPLSAAVVTRNSAGCSKKVGNLTSPPPPSFFSPPPPPPSCSPPCCSRVQTLLCSSRWEGEESLERDFTLLSTHCDALQGAPSQAVCRRHRWEAAS